EGERKIVTVFFADVAGYTKLSEKLDPEEVHQIMDGCFKILMDEIHRFEGTINQFTGDGVKALFGAPVAHEDHAQRACYAALSVQKAMSMYGKKIKADTGIEFKMRMGLNSGQVIVGSIGDDLRMDYTAVGNTTNLAARMEELAQSGSVMVSAHTYSLAADFFEFKSHGKLEVKGKEEKQEAYELIKAGEVETRIEASVSRGLTRFIGRKNSMAMLNEAFDMVKSGSGQLVGVTGEAGVGKSRLLLEFIVQLPKDEFTYLEGRCLHYGGSMVYLPILNILRSYFEIQENDREYVIHKKISDKALKLDINFEPAIPAFQELLSLKVTDEAFLKLDPESKRDRIFESLRDLFIRLSEDKHLVLAIEDLHWIDKTSEDFINYLIWWLGNANILLIILYRPEYSHYWGSKSYYTKVGLNRLGAESSIELVKAMLEDADIAPELRDLILNRSEGNPLFMEEFTQTLLENGSIKKQEDHYILSRKISSIQVPDTIQGIIASRIDRLEDNLKRTMQVASVVGREFTFRILQTITGLKKELKSSLLNLQGLEFIYEKQLFPELEYIFKHALIQEVAYNSLPQKRQGEIHEKIGEAIEEIYVKQLPEFYEMLSYHYSKGKNYEKGAKYSELAASKGFRNGSFLDAIAFGEKRVWCLERLPQKEDIQQEMIDARTSLARFYIMLNYHTKAKEIIDPIVDLVHQLNYRKALPLIHIVLGTYFLYVTNEEDQGLSHLN
ncbi:MAG: AAA family ATPase, partial [Deltaproteobacteria bacterium]|nr:AAA family ATPase [Deltaproteobacteria bacterium]